jgi:hypothetical protein
VKRLAMTILWPSFLMAGVLEVLVFAVVDPGELHWFGGASIEWPMRAIYTVTFLIFWGVISTSGALTALLSVESDDLNSLGADETADAGRGPHGT